MKPLALLALALAAVSWQAQAQPAHSPGIQPDNKVSFRLRAPKATEVNVLGQWPDGKAAMEKDMTSKDIRYQWHLTDGNHSWPVWRNYLCEFAPQLFR